MTKDQDQDQGKSLPPEPTAEQLRSWEIMAAACRDMIAAAKAGGSGWEGALSAGDRRAPSVDSQAFLNDLHVPADAGEWENGLRKILARIPDGWGRWISCGPGWYPLICELDEAIAAIDPSYEVHQVKEKFNGLRYYASYCSLEVYYRQINPRPGEGKSEDRQIWNSKYMNFLASPPGAALAAEMEPQRSAIKALIRAAEAQAEVTCELCGAPGGPCKTQSSYPWYKTLCDSCAIQNNYLNAADWDAWWEVEGPIFEARRRAERAEIHRNWVAHNRHKKILAVGVGRELAVPAYQPRNEAEAEEAAAGEWDMVFIGADSRAQAFIDRLAQLYPDLMAENRAKREKALAERGAWIPSLAPNPPGLREVTMVGNPNHIKLGALHDLGISVRGSMDHYFADFKL